MLSESPYGTTNRTENTISCHGTSKFLMVDTNYNYTPTEGPDCVSREPRQKKMKSRKSVLQESSPRTPRLTLQLRLCSGSLSMQWSLNWLTVVWGIPLKFPSLVFPSCAPEAVNSLWMLWSADSRATFTGRPTLRDCNKFLCSNTLQFRLTMFSSSAYSKQLLATVPWNRVKSLHSRLLWYLPCRP
jgi:hypothetical protein